jgi:endonuclease YncB( thermonuclease family)
MQIYVHLGGKNYGPYSIEQIRQYVQAGNFTVDQQACHDGRNWVRIGDLPGYAVAEKLKPQPKPAPKVATQPIPKKKRAKKLIIVSLCVIVFLALIGLSVVGVGYYLLDDEGTPAVTKEDIFSLTPDQIVEVYDGDTFKVDLPGMHALFGDDLSIRVLGIDTPEMKGTSDEVKALAMQAREVTEKALLGGTKIKLRNAQRGKYFRVVAEVWIDGESLADKLKAEGLAKDYDGEGARPEW